MRILLIDNHDSYTYNLFQLLATTYRTEPRVVTNDSSEWNGLDLDAFDAVVISPGPGRPQAPRDMGVCLDVLATTRLPVLGVCLGHQALALLSGADVVPAPTPRHGHLERVTHVGTDLFAGLPQDFTAVRYHSLCVARPLPTHLRELACSSDGVVMSLRHTTRPWWGVQFHPESIATEHGRALLDNFAFLAASGGPRRCASRPAPVSRPATDTASGGPSPARPTTKGLHLRVRTMEHAVDAKRAFENLFAESEYAFWLDSSKVVEGLSRFSFLGEAAGPLAEVLSYDVRSGVVDLRGPAGQTRQIRGSVFEALEDALARHSVVSGPAFPFDFHGGYVGFLGYELKSDCGSRNSHTSPLADSMWMLATRFIAIDHIADRTWLVALTTTDEPSREHADRWLDGAADVVCGVDVTSSDPDEVAEDHVDPARWMERNRQTYLADIETCLTKLREGESYEICLTNMAHLPYSGEASELYYRQRATNPAPYAALLRFGDLHVLCSSPERFLKVDRDRIAESRPIKGTTRRGSDEVEDEQLRKQLASDRKTRAENLMIVDLVRNDLGRVCAVGSVEVPQFMQVESYATVHQLVSTVRGRLRGDVSAVEATRRCFPGGSMTGAPKLRTMEIIDTLETGPRGIYSGALGYFGLRGTADLNIVIRTAVVHDGQLDVGAGGAIVLDSDPADEYHEMLLKAHAPLRGLRRRDVEDTAS